MQQGVVGAAVAAVARASALAADAAAFRRGLGCCSGPGPLQQMWTRASTRLQRGGVVAWPRRRRRRLRVAAGAGAAALPLPLPLAGVTPLVPLCRRHRHSTSSSSAASDRASGTSAAAAAAYAERRAQTAAPQSKSVGLAPALHDYLLSVSVRGTPELRDLHAETCQLGQVARMISPPDTIAVLQMLLRLVNARRVVEVGVFTGYTALGMALAIPPATEGGLLVACEREPKWPAIGRPYWQAAVRSSATTVCTASLACVAVMFSDGGADRHVAGCGRAH
jgi:hypothetical protein